MRACIFALIMVVLAACAPPIPDSGSGAGFQNSEDVQNARDAALASGQPLVPPSVLSDETLTSTAPLSATNVPAPQTAGAGNATSADIAAQTAAALAVGNSGQATLEARPLNPAPKNNVTISDENDFSAVSERQTIASDAERIASNRAQYQVITPKALPTRVGGSQPNIVEFALSTNNPRGSQVYPRSGFNSAAKSARSCARFASPDQAQSEFLSQGGPQKDRKGLDPDGDGYACSWDPAPFRRATNN